MKIKPIPNHCIAVKAERKKPLMPNIQQIEKKKLSQLTRIEKAAKTCTTPEDQKLQKWREELSKKVGAGTANDTNIEAILKHTLIRAKTAKHPLLLIDGVMSDYLLKLTVVKRTRRPHLLAEMVEGLDEE